MSSILASTARIRHTTPLPPSGSREAAVALLHDHGHYLSCNPHMTKSEPVPTPTAPAPAGLPPGLVPASGSGSGSGPAAALEWSCFRVTDVVHALPAGLWDSDVISQYEFCRTTGGVFVRIHSPMSIVMESTWEIRDAADEEEKGKGGGEDQGAGSGAGGPEQASHGLVLVEEVLISCSRLLIPVIRRQCEAGWPAIHQKMLAPLSNATA